MDKSISVFLPVRKGSERIINKNTKPFAGFSFGLLGVKLKTLIEVKEVSEIIISTNDYDAIKIGELFNKKSNKIKINHRPDSLASSETSLVDLVNYVPTLTKCQNILWTHVTSPFIESNDYSKAINKYFDVLDYGYDSLMSVSLFKNFLWSRDKNDLINRNNKEKWPRTQDLLELYEIDSGIFITSRDVYLKQNDRIGKNPFLFENDKIKSFDIDWEEDFNIAEAIYEKFFLTK